MNQLGGEILEALAAQGWTFTPSHDRPHCWAIHRPTVSAEGTLRLVHIVDIADAWLEDEDDWALRPVLLLLVVAGLVWPWPPEPDGLVLGSG